MQHTLLPSASFRAQVVNFKLFKLVQLRHVADQCYDTDSRTVQYDIDMLNNNNKHRHDDVMCVTGQLRRHTWLCNAVNMDVMPPA